MKTKKKKKTIGSVNVKGTFYFANIKGTLLMNVLTKLISEGEKTHIFELMFGKTLRQFSKTF